MRERWVTLKGNDTTSQRPGTSLIKVVSEPVVGLVVVVVVVVVVSVGLGTQEVRNAMASMAISAILKIRSSIRF
jgi:hypothetical protein